MANPRGYDIITLNHWLWFKLRCAEADGSEFQHLFEKVMKRAEPEFMAVRPYGNIGDLKSDGVLNFGDTVYQVYSPDEVTQAKLTKKINADLDGAVKHWPDMKTWVFVYNVRRGLAPKVPPLLAKKQATYPNITLKHMDSDKLWDLTRKLSVEHRTEILGPLPGQGHIQMLGPGNENGGTEAARDGWFVFVQDVLSPIDLAAVAEALQPDGMFGPPILLRPARESFSWEKAAELQRTKVEDALEKARDVRPRFAVFSLAPIPLILHLGFLLSDRVKVQAFQFDRDAGSWRWPEMTSSEEGSTELITTGIPTALDESVQEIGIRVSLSAPVHPHQTRESVHQFDAEVDIMAPNPSVRWLRRPDQLDAFGTEVAKVWTAMREYWPRCTRIHLFYAGPAPGAVLLGRAINPRMSPPVVTYEFSMQSTPCYKPAITLGAF